MEDEEKIQRKTRKHRKRKTRNDSPPLSDGDSLIGEFWEDEDRREEEKTPKKRGRKPKESLTELQQIYNVVKRLQSIAVAIPFLDRPDEKLKGMSDYYERITNPMWLKEIDRKYEAKEYNTATELAADVRLMLENCYHYWGPEDDLTKDGLELEQHFEQKLSRLSPETQKLCSLEATHGEEVAIKKEDESLDKSNPSTSQRNLSKKKGQSSRLLLWVISGRGRVGDTERQTRVQETVTKTQHTEKDEADRELLLWETKHLISEDVAEQIASMPEFPEIGQFLHLVYNVLNIEPVSHTELERMLLMPQASTTLATVITSMLIPPLARAKLEAGPAMPYSIWTSKLNNKVSQWYRLYHSKGLNSLEVFESIGIDPQFWLVMGEENPLKDYQFHELTLVQRVWLLKALCDFIMHNHKLIQECINNLDTEELREMNIGRDNKGYSYHYFPMFSEIRVYRMASAPDSKWELFESGVQVAMTMLGEECSSEDGKEDNRTIGFLRRPLQKSAKFVKQQYHDFKLIANSVDGLRCLVDEFCSGDARHLQGRGTNAALVGSLNSIISQLEPMENKILTAVYNVRTKMRDEWLEYTNRDDNYVDPGLAYWQSREKAEKLEERPLDFFSDEEKLVEKIEKMEDGSLDLLSEQRDEERRDIRERRSKRESHLKMMAHKEGNNDDSESELEFEDPFDDDSSEEWHVPGSKPKKNKRVSKKAKKLAEMAEKEDKNKNPVQIKEEMDSHKSLPNISGSVTSANSQTFKKLSNNTDCNLPVTVKQEIPDPDVDSHFNQFPRHGVSVSVKQPYQTQNLSSPKITVNPSLGESMNSNSSVIQTLVPYSKGSTSKIDISKIKRSSTPEPEADVVYISDSDDPEDIKPTKEQLLKAGNRKQSTYVMSQNGGGGFVNNPNSVYNVQPNTFLAQPNAVIPVQTQLQPQQIAYALPNQILRPQQTVLRMQSPPAGLAPGQKFVVIQQPGTNTLPSTNQQTVFINKPGLTPSGNNPFPTSPRMQTVNWYGPRNTSPIGAASPQNPLRMSSPRQRGQNYTVVQARSPQQAIRGRGAIRSPISPARMPRFSARTPNSSPQMNIRSPKTGVRIPGVGVRTPGSMSSAGVRSPLMGQRTPTNIMRSPVSGRGGIRPGAIRSLNFTPPKQNPQNSYPDIEGELKVGETDNGGFGYVVVLADGGKISLTSEQLAQIRADNGGILPKRCKVPLKPK